MILPIVPYGQPILRKIANPIEDDYPSLSTLIEDMWETLYASNGVGLAAPQINKDIRLFLVDSAQVFEHADEHDQEMNSYTDKPGVKKVFINAKILKYEGEEWAYNEGCLSIPKVREDVFRPEAIEIEYFDEHFIKHTEIYTGLTARIIQHEYDHIEGKLFIDYLKPLKKKLIQRKLSDIMKGKVRVDYKMSFSK